MSKMNKSRWLGIIAGGQRLSVFRGLLNVGSNSAVGSRKIGVRLQGFDSLKQLQ